VRIPSDVLKCVVYVGGAADRVYRGTAFAVALEENDQTGSFRFPYLVTAKHVAEKIEGKAFLVRVNMSDGSVQDLEANYLPGEVVNWHKHPTDQTADVAVTPWFLPSKADLKLIPVSMMLTTEMIGQEGIGPGDEAYITGLFSYHQGKSKNTPIVRVGNIAMLPEDKVRVKGANSAETGVEAYLVEARSIGGLSGSPVFVHPTINIVNSFFKWGTNQTQPAIVTSGTLYLLGLMCAHYDVELEDIEGTPIAGVAQGVNVGVGVVIPAQKITDIILGPELTEIRTEMKRQRTKRMAAQPDWLEKERPFTKEDIQDALSKSTRRIEAPKAEKEEDQA